MPSVRTVITSWFCSEGGGAPVTSTFGGTSTSSPICRIGVATMKMMSSTSTTSTSGVMLISDRTPWPEPADMDIGYLFLGCQWSVASGQKIFLTTNHWPLATHI